MTVEPSISTLSELSSAVLNILSFRKALLVIPLQTSDSSQITVTFVQNWGWVTTDYNLLYTPFDHDVVQIAESDRGNTSVYKCPAQKEVSVPRGSPTPYLVNQWLRAISWVHSLIKPLIRVPTPGSCQK